MRLVISGGGTAGHINPALAAADYAKKYMNAEILFVGTERGLEKSLVKSAGYDIKYIDVEGLKRSLSPRNMIVAAKYLRSISECKKIIKEFRPDAVLGTGGYVCAPVMEAAASLDVPSVIHEQNVIPGVTVKMSVSKAARIATSFPDTKRYINPKYAQKCCLTGNPLSDEMLALDYSTARRKLSLDSRPLIVMVGGSLGAERLNEAMTEFINSSDTEKFYFCAGTGKRYYSIVMENINKNKLTNTVKIEPYIYNREILYPAADLIISRAGALTVSEICALGKPSILIPSPNVAHNHQELNARSVSESGGAVMLLERELTQELFTKTVNDIINDKMKRESMAMKAKEMGITDAAKRICAILNGVIHDK